MSWFSPHCKEEHKRLKKAVALRLQSAYDSQDVYQIHLWTSHLLELVRGE